jgi:hypothetical protein
MLSMPGSAARRDPIYLTDERLEQSGVPDELLDIMYAFEMEQTSRMSYAVIELAEKWDFAQVLLAIRRHLPHHKSNIDMFSRFQMSNKLKDASLIAGFLKRKYLVSWLDSSTVSAIDDFRQNRLIRLVYDEAAPGLLNESFVGGARLFDVATWAYGDFLLTPPTVLWALLRATYVGTTKPAKIDSDKVAVEFRRLLTLACESPRIRLS